MATSPIRALRCQKIDVKGVIYPHARSPLFDVKCWDLTKEREHLAKNLRWRS